MTPKDLEAHIRTAEAVMELLDGAVGGIKAVKIGKRFEQEGGMEIYEIDPSLTELDDMIQTICDAMLDALMCSMRTTVNQLEQELTRKVHEANPDHVAQVGDTKDLN